MPSPSLIGRVDFHVHRRPDAGMTTRAAIEAFQSKGYLRIGFTDHFDPASMAERIWQTRQEIGKAEPRLAVFVGTEASVHLGWPRDELEEMRSTILDFCLLAPSHYPRSRDVPEFTKQSLESQASWIMESFEEAVRVDFADAVAHPFAYGQIPRLDEVLSLIDDRDLKLALRQARRNAIAMDLSPRICAIDEVFLGRFLGISREVGVKFSVGSDAHTLENIGNDRLILPILRRHGITDPDLWLPNSCRAISR